MLVKRNTQSSRYVSWQDSHQRTSTKCSKGLRTHLVYHAIQGREHFRWKTGLSDFSALSYLNERWMDHSFQGLRKERTQYLWSFLESIRSFTNVTPSNPCGKLERGVLLRYCMWGEKTGAQREETNGLASSNFRKNQIWAQPGDKQGPSDKKEREIALWIFYWLLMPRDEEGCSGQEWLKLTPV